MSGLDSVSANCQWCGGEINPNLKGACPRCGARGKNLHASVSGTVTVTGKLTVVNTREFYENNPRWLAFNIILIIATSVAGVFLVGPLGIAFGIITGLLAYFFVPSGINKVRERTER